MCDIILLFYFLSVKRSILSKMAEYRADNLLPINDDRPP